MVPNDAKVLEPVLKRAQEAGIKVITHESPGQINADWDFELLDTQSMGANHMKDMAQCMGEEGKYAMFVGSLTVPLVNEWADAAIAYQKPITRKWCWLKTASVSPSLSMTPCVLPMICYLNIKI